MKTWILPTAFATLLLTAAFVHASDKGGPDERGRFGIFGGRFVAETLMPNILELDKAYEEAKEDPAFHEELKALGKHYTGRPNGYVGGFAQTLDAALFKSISHHSGLPGLYLTGDHIFPGGGTIGVAASGIHCARSISGKALLT